MAIALVILVAALFSSLGGDDASRKRPSTPSRTLYGSADGAGRASARAAEATPPAVAPSPPIVTPPAPAIRVAAVVPAPTRPPEPTPSVPVAPPVRTARPLPPSMVVTPDTPACEIHEVVKGDTLWWIAARRLGSPYKWPRLFGENRDRLADPNVIEVHDRIRVPGGCEPTASR